LSFNGAVTASLSVVDCCLEGGFGFGFEVIADEVATSGFGVAVREDSECEFILLSDLIASFVENIRVSRFVIEGFSAASSFCGSVGGGAACPFPFPLRLSVLETAATETPFCAVIGREAGEPTADDVCEPGGVGAAVLWVVPSRWAETVAMVFVR